MADDRHIEMCGMDFSSSVRFRFGFDKNRGFGSVSVSVSVLKKPPVRFGFFVDHSQHPKTCKLSFLCVHFESILVDSSK